MSSAGLPDYGSDLVRTVVVLAILCVAIFLLVRWVKGRGMVGGTRGGRARLRVVAQCRLDGQHGLFLIEVADRCLLLGTAQASVRKLAELDCESLERDAETVSRPFLDLLLSRRHGATIRRASDSAD